MPTPEISVQLFSIHDELDADLDGSLGKLAATGLTTVEPFNFVHRADALKASFDRYGLRSPTAHAALVEREVTTPDGVITRPPAEEVFAAAQQLGVQVVIEPHVPLARWQTLEDLQRSADRLNDAAAKAAELGLKVGYHNHDHELSATIDGTPALEVFAGLLDPAVVLEVDLYWAAAGGVDPVGLLGRLGDRVIAVHVKDGPITPGMSSRQRPLDQQPAGRGDVPLVAALETAKSAEYAVIEFDHYEGDTFAGIAESYAFLRTHLGR
jgi:sugar phosphate isomerase/epimerase